MASEKKKPKIFRSVCWNYMELVENEDVVRCKLCGHRFNYTSRSTPTSNLIRHVEYSHRDVPGVSEDIKTARRSSSFTKSKKISASKNKNKVTVESVVLPSSQPVVVAEPPTSSHLSTIMMNDLNKTSTRIPEVKKEMLASASNTIGSIRKRCIDATVLDFIVIDNEPLSIVEQEGFKMLVKALDSTYNLVSQKQLEDDLLPQRYQNEKDKLIEELTTIESKVSLSIDCWMSYTSRAYITISAHYITSDWQLKNSCLATKWNGSCHTVEFLASAMDETLKAFYIEEKVNSVVTDKKIDVSDVVKAFNASYQSCFAHTLNQVIQESMEGVEPMKSLLKKVRDIVAYFNSSVMASKNLQEIQERKGKVARIMTEEVIEGWNSTFEMLRSYLSQHDEVSTVLSLSGRHILCIHSPDTHTLRAAINTLLPFYEATQELSSEKYTQASKIIPMMKMLKRLAARSDSPLSRSLLENLDYRFQGIEEQTQLQLATLLDPRFRKSAFSSPEAAARALESLKKEACKTGVADEPEPEQQKASVEPQAKKQSLLWSDFDEEMEGFQGEDDSLKSKAVEIEIQSYFSMSSLPRDKDPLSWWRDNGWSLPRLQAIAKDVLAIPATAVPSNRLFSKEGTAVVFKRSKLQDENVDQILFLSKNQFSGSN